MKKISALNQKLQKINDLLQNTPPMDALSFGQFIKYKRILKQKEKIKHELKKSMLAGQNVIAWYEKYDQELINNMKISCRQYCRKQTRAEYKRNITLYRLGLTDKKPRHPILGPISNKFSILSKVIQIPFKYIHKKFENLRSNIIPKHFNNIAIGTAKVGIRGYRTLKSNCSYIKQKFNSSDYSKYLRNIISEAENQLNSPAPVITQYKTNSYKPSSNQIQRSNIIHYECSR